METATSADTAAPVLPDAPTPPTNRRGMLLSHLVDAFAITTLINLGGTALVHYTMGVPVDPAVMAVFQGVGFGVGAGYGPAKQALIDAVTRD